MTMAQRPTFWMDRRSIGRTDGQVDGRTLDEIEIERNALNTFKLQHMTRPTPQEILLSSFLGSGSKGADDLCAFILLEA